MGGLSVASGRSPIAVVDWVLADSLTGHGANVLTGDAEVGEFAVRHAAEFGDGLAILDPAVVGACDVHFGFLSSRLRSE